MQQAYSLKNGTPLVKNALSEEEFLIKEWPFHGSEAMLYLFLDQTEFFRYRTA